MKMVFNGLIAATLLGGLGGIAQAQDTTGTSPQTIPVPSDPAAPTDPLEPMDPTTPGELPTTDPLDPNGPVTAPPTTPTSPAETAPAPATRPAQTPDTAAPPAGEGAMSEEPVDEDMVSDPATDDDDLVTPDAPVPPR